MYTIEDIERILETYSLETILELNEMEEADLVYLLVSEELIKLPDPEPVQ